MGDGWLAARPRCRSGIRIRAITARSRAKPKPVKFRVFRRKTSTPPQLQLFSSRQFLLESIDGCHEAIGWTVDLGAEDFSPDLEQVDVEV